MSATRTRRPTDAETVPQAPVSTPYSVGLGVPGHDFTLQAVMELHKSVGELNANVQSMKTSLDGLKGKVDDLVKWKNMIIGGAAVFGFAFAALGVVIGKASEYVTLKSPPSLSAPAPMPAPAPTVPK